MQFFRRFLALCALAVPLAGQASDIKVRVSLHLSGWWWPFAPNYAPLPSPHHIFATIAPAPAKDGCTFVAGVRHCPRAEPR
jgi:hypothetical protein